jgi:hypothetical protein
MAILGKDLSSMKIFCKDFGFGFSSIPECISLEAYSF